ncbi:HD-GYP domain-containing protein [Gorillibacterium sp. CAU 1737]|uniref:HD-GYP domain-containing protein n=1 Tax=Gorillibacterium sp. CAU 1737 TaxID=3140362 RepID=UPI00326109E5
MKGTKVRLAACKDGDVLAEDVHLPNGILLITRYSPLNDYILRRLAEHCIEEVQVLPQDDSSPTLMKEYHAGVRKLGRIFRRLIAGVRIESREIEAITDRLFACLEEPSHIAWYLNEVQAKDEYTYSHSVNVSIYSLLIAKWMGLPPSEIRKAGQAGLVHDVGKLLIPEGVLNKPGALTGEEFALMQQHSRLGYEMLGRIPDLPPEVRDAALHHHERLDGNGYPTRTPLPKLSVAARIVAVADVFDAMTTNRIYKKASSPFEAFHMFSTTGRAQFDPEVLCAFLERMPSCYTGTKVYLSNGQEGEIVYVSPYQVSSPIVRIEDDYKELGPFHSTKITKLAI